VYQHRLSTEDGLADDRLQRGVRDVGGASAHSRTTGLRSTRIGVELRHVQVEEPGAHSVHTGRF
jgi:hypothetical protein